MRPTLAQCTNGSCNTNISLFTNNRTSMVCPACKRPLDMDVTDNCQTCKCRIPKGAVSCKSCSLAKLPPKSPE